MSPKSLREKGKACICQELPYLSDIPGGFLSSHHSQEVGGAERGDPGQWKRSNRMGRSHITLCLKFSSMQIVFKNMKPSFFALQCKCFYVVENKRRPTSEGDE